MAEFVIDLVADRVVWPTRPGFSRAVAVKALNGFAPSMKKGAGRDVPPTLMAERHRMRLKAEAPQRLTLELDGGGLRVEPRGAALTLEDVWTGWDLLDATLARRLDDYAGVSNRATAERLPTPQSAWILVADAASLLTDGGLDAFARYEGVDSEWTAWTCSPHVQRGDLVFLYAVAPVKAVCFVGRAMCGAYWSSKRSVASVTPVAATQWWTHLGAIVRVKPIPLGRVHQVCGHVNLKGRAGKPVAPDAANTLLAEASIRYASAPWVERCAVVPVRGLRHLPDPGRSTLGQLRDIPASSLKLERDVESHIVEPLVRLCRLAGGGVEVLRQFRIGRGLADYAIVRKGGLCAVVEVKRRIRRDRDADWATSPDVGQAARYADGRPFLLVDVEHIACFRGRRLSPRRLITRRTMTSDDLRWLRSFLLGGAGKSGRPSVSATATRARRMSAAK